ncbi:class I SAM-dependent DNA methyltransferase [Nisaea sediminum]|uniref:class I SAM-dependent DNA methyltransferase n=1 Tax=Nisaea sediminum TaxID=2775867 RepID=UPI0018691E69|nr:methyltransferase [Nisaea sediminum]
MAEDPGTEVDILHDAVGSGDWEAALPILQRKALDAAGDSLHWSNLATVQRAAGQDPSTALRRAITLDPDVPGYLNDLGAGESDPTPAPERLLVLDPLHIPAALMSALRALGNDRRKRGFRILRRLRISDPGNLDATFILGQFLDLAGRAGEAVRLYRATLCIAPEDPMGVRRDLARHGVAPVRQAYSSTYVKRVFDGYAKSFDAHLTGRLKYSGPETLRLLGLASGILSEKRKAACALDLGCGTGLTGAAIRPYCAEMTGIDISSEMLRVAEEKRIYHRLLAGDAVSVLEREDALYDVAIAADVSSYIGDLEPFFRAVSARLQPGGGLLMTAHEPTGADEDGIGIGLDGAHSHSLDYLQQAARAAGLTLLEARRGSMREEGGVPLATLFLAFAKPV